MTEQPVDTPPRMAEEICPGFPDKCPNIKTVEPDPPTHYGGIRCGCADQPPAERTEPRLTVDTITSDQLDALYDELATLRRDNGQLLEDQAECIRLEAELQRLRTESPWLRATAEDLTTAQAAIARVRALHKPADYRGRTICADCSAYCGSSTDNAPVEHPCPTLAALDEPKEPTT